MQAHYANMEALKTQTIAYSYPSSVYNSCIAADGIYLPSILLFSLFPLLVTLPAGVSMAMDIKSGYIKNLRVRKEQKSVILSRYISIFAGAFLLAMAATFGQMVFSMMFLPTIAPEICLLYTSNCNYLSDLIIESVRSSYHSAQNKKELFL